MGIPTPIPQTIADLGNSARTSSLTDIVWVGGVTVSLLAVAFAIISVLPVVGGLVLIALAGYLLRDQIEGTIEDTYSRDFWTWRR